MRRRLGNPDEHGIVPPEKGSARSVCWRSHTRLFAWIAFPSAGHLHGGRIFGLRSLHRYEEMDALCIGIIRRESGDDDVCYYPFFQYSVEGAQSRWFPRRQMSRKRYQPGNWYTLYRDPGTGRCALKPSAWDLTSALLSLIPLGFFVLLVLSLAVCAVGSLWIAALGLVQILAV